MIIDDKLGTPYFYGSHYSSPATVLHLMMRMEPYTSAFKKLGGGKFDLPDRLAQSIQRAYNSAYNNL